MFVFKEIWEKQGKAIGKTNKKAHGTVRRDGDLQKKVHQEDRLKWGRRMSTFAPTSSSQDFRAILAFFDSPNGVSLRLNSQQQLPNGP